MDSKNIRVFACNRPVFTFLFMIVFQSRFQSWFTRSPLASSATEVLVKSRQIITSFDIFSRTQTTSLSLSADILVFWSRILINDINCPCGEMNSRCALNLARRKSKGVHLWLAPVIRPRIFHWSFSSNVNNPLLKRICVVFVLLYFQFYLSIYKSSPAPVSSWIDPLIESNRVVSIRSNMVNILCVILFVSLKKLKAWFTLVR